MFTLMHIKKKIKKNKNLNFGANKTRGTLFPVRGKVETTHNTLPVSRHPPYYVIPKGGRKMVYILLMPVGVKGLMYRDEYNF